MIYENCESCSGTGKAVFSCCTGDTLKGIYSDYMMCPICKEHLAEEDCPDCETNKIANENN